MLLRLARWISLTVLAVTLLVLGGWNALAIWFRFDATVGVPPGEHESIARKVLQTAKFLNLRWEQEGSRVCLGGPGPQVEAEQHRAADGTRYILVRGMDADDLPF
jgi:hypothetical protein